MLRAVSDHAHQECVFHDLRHPNAVHTLSEGARLDHVARHLSNGLVICEKYDISLVQSDRELEGMNADIVARRKARDAAQPRPGHADYQSVRRRRRVPARYKK